MLTTTSITTVSVSIRSAQSAASAPEWMKVKTGTVKASPSPSATWKKATQERIAETTSSAEVISSAAREPCAGGVMVDAAVRLVMCAACRRMVVD